MTSSASQQQRAVIQQWSYVGTAGNDAGVHACSYELWSLSHWQLGRAGKEFHRLLVYGACAQHSLQCSSQGKATLLVKPVQVDAHMVETATCSRASFVALTLAHFLLLGSSPSQHCHNRAAVLLSTLANHPS